MDGQLSEFFFLSGLQKLWVAVAWFLPGRVKDLSAPRYNSAPTGKIFKKFNLNNFHDKSRKFKFYENLKRKTTLYEHLRTYVIISLSVLLIMRNISDKFVDKIQKYILFSVIFFF